MLTIKGLKKHYGDKLILDNINLEVNQGQILGILGPNGMGKTTLLRSIVGIIKPEEGNIVLNGIDILQDPFIKQNVGYVAEYQNYYQNFKVSEMVNLYRLTYVDWNEKRYQQLKSLFNLSEQQKIKTISKGMRTQLAFLLNLPLMPKLLVLDEPTSGLDPIIRKQVLNLIVEQVADFKTITIISSHNTSELERICDQVAFIRYGKIVLNQGMEDLKHNMRKVMVVFPGEYPPELENHPDILNVERFNRTYTLVIKKELLGTLAQYNTSILEELEMSLEDIYIHQMGGENNVSKNIAL